MPGLQRPGFKSSAPPSLRAQGPAWHRKWPPFEAASLFAFATPGICDSGRGVCLLTMSLSSFAEGKHSVHWFLWISWLVSLARVQWLFLCSHPPLGLSQEGRERAARSECQRQVLSVLWALQVSARSNSHQHGQVQQKALEVSLWAELPRGSPEIKLLGTV